MFSCYPVVQQSSERAVVYIPLSVAYSISMCPHICGIALTGITLTNFVIWGVKWKKSGQRLNHRIPEAGRHLWSWSSPSLCSGHGHLQQVAVQQGLEHPHNLSGQPVPVSDHPHNKKLYVSVEFLRFPRVLVAFCPATGHCREEPGSIFFAAPTIYSYHEVPLSLLLSRLRSPSFQRLLVWLRGCVVA